MTDAHIDLGPIDPGRSPSERITTPGAHPWAPSELVKWDRSVTAGQVEQAASDICYTTEHPGKESTDWPDIFDAREIVRAVLESLGITVLE
jgi:hypothetical protein